MQRSIISIARRAALTVLLFIGVPGGAWAQSSMLQSGPAAPGQVPVYQTGAFGQASALESAPASGGTTGQGINELLQINRGLTPASQAPFAGTGSGPLGMHDCRYSGPITAPAGGYYVCLDADIAGKPSIAFGSYGAAPWNGATFYVQGSPLPFPGPGTGDVLGPTSAVSGNVVKFD